MTIASFDEVSERRGVWLPVSGLSTLLQRIDNVATKIEPARAEIFRDALKRDAEREARPIREQVETDKNALAFATYLSTLCDLVVFDNLFIDKIAWESSGDHKNLFPAALGPLAKNFILVEPDRSVYVETADILNSLVVEVLREKGLKYLEEADPSRRNDSYWEGSFKCAFDFFKSNKSLRDLNAPSTFIDSQGSIERAMFYIILQKMSGAPARLTYPRLELLNNLQTFLPDRVKTALRAASPSDDAQKLAASKLIGSEELEAPPIFEMLMREIGAAKTPKSVIEIIAEIREWRDVRLYREWLWSYFKASEARDFARIQQVRKELGGHLDAMIAAGDARTRRTKMVSLSFPLGQIMTAALSASLGVAIPAPIPNISAQARFWRWRSEDYVGFIGDWFAVGARPSEDRIV